MEVSDDGDTSDVTVSFDLKKKKNKKNGDKKKTEKLSCKKMVTFLFYAFKDSDDLCRTFIKMGEKSQETPESKGQRLTYPDFLAKHWLLHVP